MPILMFTQVQYDAINIQLLYNPNMPMEPKLQNGSFHPISLHGFIEHLISDFKNIRELLNHIAKYISNQQIYSKKSNDVENLKGVSEAI